MKILHKYEDGTLKVAYKNGEISLLPPVSTLDVKIMVMRGDDIFTIPIAGGVPVKIENEEDAKWIRVAGITEKELIHKVIINTGLTTAHSLGEGAINRFIGLLRPLYFLFGKKEKPEKT